KVWRHPAGSVSAVSCATRCATSSISLSRTWVSSKSRTSPGRCVLTAFGSILQLMNSPADEPSAAAVATTRSAQPLPQKPCIAVLPFANMSGDAEQEYFSEGITEDIITNLSHNHAFFVISRSTSFAFKGPAVDVGKIG